jgi:hypothetical protein
MSAVNFDAAEVRLERGHCTVEPIAEHAIARVLRE